MSELPAGLPAGLAGQMGGSPRSKQNKCKNNKTAGSDERTGSQMLLAVLTMQQSKAKECGVSET